MEPGSLASGCSQISNIVQTYCGCVLVYFIYFFYKFLELFKENKKHANMMLYIFLSRKENKKQF